MFRTVAPLFSTRQTVAPLLSTDRGPSLVDRPWPLSRRQTVAPLLFRTVAPLLPTRQNARVCVRACVDVCAWTFVREFKLARVCLRLCVCAPPLCCVWLLARARATYRKPALGPADRSVEEGVRELIECAPLARCQQRLRVAARTTRGVGVRLFVEGGGCQAGHRSWGWVSRCW